MSIRLGNFLVCIFVAALTCTSPKLALAQNQPTRILKDKFSLTPPKPCKVPPRAPPRALLGKTYKSLGVQFNVHQIDIDGDGICDWLMEGFQPTFDELHHDLELSNSLRLENFLFLGTERGWRRLKPLAIKSLKELSPTFQLDFFQAGIPSTAWRTVFLSIAAAVYQEGRPEPLVVAFETDDRSDFAPLRSVRILKWNSTHELFEMVPGPDTWSIPADPLYRKVLQFLAKTYCHDGLDPEIAVKDSPWGYALPMVTPQFGGLCPLK